MYPFLIQQAGSNLGHSITLLSALQVHARCTLSAFMSHFRIIGTPNLPILGVFCSQGFDGTIVDQQVFMLDKHVTIQQLVASTQRRLSHWFPWDQGQQAHVQCVKIPDGLHFCV